MEFPPAKNFARLVDFRLTVNSTSLKNRGSADG